MPSWPMPDSDEPLPFRGGPADGQLFEASIGRTTKWVTVPIVGVGKARYLVERMNGRPIALVYLGDLKT